MAGREQVEKGNWSDSRKKVIKSLSSFMMMGSSTNDSRVLKLSLSAASLTAILELGVSTRFRVYPVVTSSSLVNELMAHCKP